MDLRSKFQKPEKTSFEMQRKEVSAAASMGYGFIYFIGFDGDEGEAPIKVGYTWKLNKRLNEIQCGNWRTALIRDVIFVRAAISYSDMQKAFRSGDELRCNDGGTQPSDAERLLHNEYASLGLRHSREWFNGGVQELVDIGSSVLKRNGVKFCMVPEMRKRARVWLAENGHL